MRQISWQAAPALQLIKRPNALSCPHTQMPGPPRGVAPVEGAHVEGCQIRVGQPWDLVADFSIGLHVRDKNVPIHLVDQHPVERPLCPSLGARCVRGVRGGVSCGTGGGSAVLLDAAGVLPVRRRRAGGGGCAALVSLGVPAWESVLVPARAAPTSAHATCSFSRRKRATAQQVVASACSLALWGRVCLIASSRTWAGEVPTLLRTNTHFTGPRGPAT